MLACRCAAPSDPMCAMMQPTSPRLGGLQVDFFPDPRDPPGMDDPPDPAQPVWAGAPEDVLPGVVPVELVLGQSQTTLVLLTGIRAFPTGLEMKLGVRVRGRVGRRDLNSEVFDGPYCHEMDSDWQIGRLKWGFELADGRRATNVDPSPWLEQPNQEHSRPHHPDDWKWEPDHPVLHGGGGGGGMRSVDRDYWLWPLPPVGPLRVVCQWLDQGIDTQVQDLDAGPFRDAAARAQPAWLSD